MEHEDRSLVLIVDDDDSVRSMMVQILSLFSAIDCVEAPNAAKALDAIRGGGVDAMVLDDFLGLERGIDVYRRALTIDPGLRGRVLFTSGKTFDRDNQDFFKSENLRFLSKPFMIEDFVSAVKSLLGGKMAS